MCLMLLNLLLHLELAKRLISPRCQHFVCHHSLHQALLGCDDNAWLFHSAPTARCQHGWHLPGASLSSGHRPGTNHGAQHQHNLHHRWVWQLVADSESQFQVCFIATVVYCVIAGSPSDSRALGGLQRVGRIWLSAGTHLSSWCLFFCPEKEEYMI